MYSIYTKNDTKQAAAMHLFVFFLFSSNICHYDWWRPVMLFQFLVNTSRKISRKRQTQRVKSGLLVHANGWTLFLLKELNCSTSTKGQFHHIYQLVDYLTQNLTRAKSKNPKSNLDQPSFPKEPITKLLCLEWIVQLETNSHHTSTNR